jgi:hyperosmotically inducible protein
MRMLGAPKRAPSIHVFGRRQEVTTMDSKRLVAGACVAAALTLIVAPNVRAAASDPWITTKAKLALFTAEGVSASGINVDTVDGIVSLHGTVDSEAEKSNAEAVVHDIDGVGSVRNLLQVVPGQHQERVAASDKDVKANVEKVLADRAALADVRVQSVNDGVVLLGGEVNGLNSHLWAVALASQVPGVRRVASEIESPDELGGDAIRSDRAPALGGPGKGLGAAASDVLITSAVKTGLLADTRTPGLDVNVDTQDGKVTLFGIVDSAAARVAAEEHARKVSGVTTVVNDLQVVPASKKRVVKEQDAAVEARIETAISARDDLRDADIAVDVRNGVARLTGTVPSESQRLAAAVVARASAGVRAVRDDLRIGAH